VSTRHPKAERAGGPGLAPKGPGPGRARCPRKLHGIIARPLGVALLVAASDPNRRGAVGGWCASGPRSARVKRTSSDVCQCLHDLQSSSNAVPPSAVGSVRQRVQHSTGSRAVLWVNGSGITEIRYPTPTTYVAFRRAPQWPAGGSPTCLLPPRKGNRWDGVIGALAGAR